MCDVENDLHEPSCVNIRSYLIHCVGSGEYVVGEVENTLCATWRMNCESNTKYSMVLNTRATGFDLLYVGSGSDATSRASCHFLNSVSRKGSAS